MTSLSIAIFFELAWLDMIPAGTYIPPHLGAAVFTALSLASFHHLVQPGEVALVMVAGVPMAWLGKRAEALLRCAQGRCHDRAVQWAGQAESGPFPERLIYSSVLRSFLVSWLFFFGSLLAINFIVGRSLHPLRPLLDELHLDWPHLWLAASLGGLLALRVRKAYALFFSGAALVGIAIFSHSL